jgi:hypothetical protein
VVLAAYLLAGAVVSALALRLRDIT